jgi:ABC-type oligopeptide transport system ATPase subunit
MLTLDRVSKVYKVGTFGGDELPAVRDVSFSVLPGEVVSLIGESGCGKTTIGRMILRLASISSGSITFGDLDVSTLKGDRLKAYYRRVQGIFQDPFSSYNPIFKVDHAFDLLRASYFSDLAGPAWDEKLEGSLAAVNLDADRVLRKYPHQLSGGQLQRLLVARALLLDIEILVADEIISMLDASTRIDVLNLLGDLKARGLGILFVTHDLSLGNYISDRTVILRRGRVVEQGATTLVFGNPLHPYTRMLLAAVPHLHERWSAGDRADAAGRPALDGACLYHRAIREAPSAVGSASQFVETEAGHLVACAHVDDPAGCPEAEITA